MRSYLLVLALTAVAFSQYYVQPNLAVNNYQPNPYQQLQQPSFVNQDLQTPVLQQNGLYTQPSLYQQQSFVQQRRFVQPTSFYQQSNSFVQTPSFYQQPVRYVQPAVVQPTSFYQSPASLYQAPTSFYSQPVAQPMAYATPGFTRTTVQTTRRVMPAVGFLDEAGVDAGVVTTGQVSTGQVITGQAGSPFAPVTGDRKLDRIARRSQKHASKSQQLEMKYSRVSNRKASRELDKAPAFFVQTTTSA